MGKTSKWLRNLLTSGKKHKDKDKRKYGAIQNSSNATENPTIPAPKEKRRWSFRRPSASKQFNSAETNVTTPPTLPPAATVADQNLQKKHLTITPNRIAPTIEEAAAIKIQSVFRSYLARKALSALRGIVKLQALVRGQLVRKQATTTLRCMQALLTAQARACAQRIRMASEGKSNQRHSTQDSSIRHVYDEIDRGLEENIKIVEMDVSESKGNCRSRNSNINYTQQDGSAHRFCTYYPLHGSYSKENYKVSPAPSAQSSPASKPDDTKLPFTSPVTSHYPSVPNYMANTESSRAKFRSHSAPKQRPPDSLERQLSRPRASMEARNTVQKPILKMRRSSSHVGATAQDYQYPCSIKLDRSTVSLIESECGSTSTVLTNTQYCRSLAAYDPHEDRYY